MNDDNDPFKEFEEFLEEVMSDFFEDSTIRKYEEFDKEDIMGGKDEKKHPVTKFENERLVDVIDMEDDKVVIINTPGFKEEDFNIKLEGKILIVEGINNEGKKISERVEIDSPVKDEYDYEINNGILRILLQPYQD